MNKQTKGKTMNNIKKIGLTALAGSLVMVSANAVDYTMSGGLMATYTTEDAPTAIANNGKGIGTATDLAFNASGELDNGFTVGYMMAIDTDGALSNTSSQMTVGMGSLGTIQLNNKFGSKANAIDDVTPNAYNETWDGLSTVNPSFFGSSTTAGSIDYRIPAQELMGVTINASYTYDPASGTAGATKGGVSATNPGSGEAYTLQLSHDSGIEIGGGIEEVNTNSSLVNAQGLDRATAYVKYAVGGLTLAYQEAFENAATSAAVSTGADREAEFMGVAYTMNDMTVSYATSELSTNAIGATAATVAEELTSIQAAYVMGAMTVSVALSETDNLGGTAGAKYEENTLAVSFAF
tara:strand:+ start:1301 stop:2353 length:1053 start_codon:yes stop_codon:yes gene_type:complete